jgi:hypothetical protein
VRWQTSPDSKSGSCECSVPVREDVNSLRAHEDAKDKRKDRCKKDVGQNREYYSGLKIRTSSCGAPSSTRKLASAREPTRGSSQTYRIAIPISFCSAG